jgi:uncharacterized protein (TIGR02145 family)
MKKTKIILTSTLFMFLVSCGSKDSKTTSNESTKNENVKSADTLGANEVRIGSQIWMSENLNVEKFSNGDLIMEAKSPEEWERAGKEGKPAWCYYDNNPNNNSKYGKLYNWYAVKDSRGLAPKGWHIPSDEEWNMLANNSDSIGIAPSLKSDNGWLKDANGTNKSRFNAFPGGFRYFVGGFGYVGEYAAFWTSTPFNSLRSFHRYLNQSSQINRDKDGFDNGGGLSVRCIKD